MTAGVRRTGAVATWPALLVVLGVSLAVAGCGSKQPPALSDVERVRCLGPAGTGAVAGAAVALDLVDGPAADPSQVRVKGQDLTVAAWRQTAPSEFQQACRAVLAAEDPPAATGGSGVPSWMTPIVALLAAVVGAVTAGMVKAYLDGGVRRWETVTAARAALRGYRKASDAYLRGWRDDGDRLGEETVLAAQESLADALSSLTAAHGGWVLVAAAEERLRGDPISARLDLRIATSTDRTAQLDLTDDELHSRITMVDVVMGKAEKPLRHIWALHRAPKRLRRRLGIVL